MPALSVRATRDLAGGAQLFTSYGPEVGRMPAAERRARLHAVYHFDCRCVGCGEELAAERRRHEAPSPTVGRRGARALPAGREAEELAEEALAPSQLRARAEALDVRAHEACERGRFAEAAALVEAALQLLRRILTPGCAMLAHEDAKLARLRFNAIDDAASAEAAAAALGRAALAMQQCFGAGHEEAIALRRLQAMCSQ